MSVRTKDGLPAFSLPVLLAATLALLCLPSSSHATIIPVVEYDMNNGNGATQFTGGKNYFDYTYSANGSVVPNASQNGSNLPIPANTSPQNAPLTGGTGLLTDGIIPMLNYSLVTGNSGVISGDTGAYSYLNGQSTEYVGWKYQDPNILFKLGGLQSVGQIQLFVAAANSGGLVGAPANVGLTLINKLTGQSSTTSYTETIASYDGSASTDVITLSLKTPLSASLYNFSLTLYRGPLEADGIAYYVQHVEGFNPSDPYGPNTCVQFCDPSFGPYSSGFWQQAALYQTGAPPSTPWGLEPWIMLGQVQFDAASISTPPAPEPSTWVMMIVGFAGLGFMAYRRRDRVMKSMVA